MCGNIVKLRKNPSERQHHGSKERTKGTNENLHYKKLFQNRAKELAHWCGLSDISGWVFHPVLGLHTMYLIYSTTVLYQSSWHHEKKMNILLTFGWKLNLCQCSFKMNIPFQLFSFNPNLYFKSKKKIKRKHFQL